MDDEDIFWASLPEIDFDQPFIPEIIPTPPF